MESRPIRVAIVSPEPTPYRAPLFDRIAALPELDVTVIYAAETVAGRTWSVHSDHRAVVLGGIRIPGAARLLNHDYPVSLRIWRELEAAAPDCVAVSGWSTFASQAAVVWSRVRRVPYVLIVESHDAGPRAGWRRAVKSAVVPRIVRKAEGVLVTGALARASMLQHGAAPGRVRIFANTVDVDEWTVHADELRARRAELRTGFGLADEDVAVLCVARNAPEKGLDTLVAAVAQAGDDRLALLLVGPGMNDATKGAGGRVSFGGDLPHDRVVEAYVAADVFALLSRHEPWGVVVNEAAACGLPLVLSDRVGAAPDLLRDGENGMVVPAGDVSAAADAFRRLAADPELRAAFGARSRELVGGWGYRPSVENFLDAVEQAVAR